jgi:hypothetical protein
MSLKDQTAAALARLFPRRDLIRAYQAAFTGPAAEAVLGDLALFCGQQQSSVRVNGQKCVDPYAMAVAEGRREVLLRITAMMRCDESRLWQWAERERQLKGQNNG